MIKASVRETIPDCPGCEEGDTVAVGIWFVVNRCCFGAGATALVVAWRLFDGFDRIFPAFFDCAMHPSAINPAVAASVISVIGR